MKAEKNHLLKNPGIWLSYVVLIMSAMLFLDITGLNSRFKPKPAVWLFIFLRKLMNLK